MASGSSDLSKSCVIPGLPLHRVDSRLIIVETDADDLDVSGVADEAPAAAPGVLGQAGVDPAAEDNRTSSSVTSPCWAKG
jgi:hypothetical protein